MTVTTSLKLPDALKATIAQVAALEGKSAHALMVDALQTAMDDALARAQGGKPSAPNVVPFDPSRPMRKA